MPGSKIMANFTAILVAILIFTTASHAQDVDARTLYMQGTEAFEAQEWATCASKYEEAFLMIQRDSSLPQERQARMLFNIALCYQRDGEQNPERALEAFSRASGYYTRYLREMSEGDVDQEAIEAQLRVLRSAVNALQLNVTPPTPTVAHEEDWEEDRLAPPMPVTEETTNRVPLTQDTTRNNFRFRRTVISASATAVVAVVGVALAASAQNSYNNCIDQGCESQRDSIQRRATAANVMFAGAAVGAATTAVMVVLDVRSSGAVVGVSGRF